VTSHAHPRRPGAHREDGFSIRSAREEDIPLVVRLIRELAAYENLLDQTILTEETLRKSLFERDAAEVIIGELGGETVGYALFFQNFSIFTGKPGIYIEDLYVREAFRGRGFGARLLARVARIAVERDCSRVEWSVLDWNEPAIAFYRRRGAVPLRGWTGFRLAGERLLRLAEE
jgi:GNAT superfamily N-acetyltransferase